MADSTAPVLLPPAAVITSTDEGGIALIVTAMGLAFAIVSVLIRIYVRYEFCPNRLRWDDGIIGIAFVSTGSGRMRDNELIGWQLFSIFQSATVFVEVHHGFGKVKDDISPRELLAIQKVCHCTPPIEGKC